MKKNSQSIVDPRMKTFGIVVIVLIFVGVLFIFAGDKQNESDNIGTPKLKASQFRYDFGDVSMKDGLVLHDFVLENVGDGDLKILDMETSCMCTTAILDVDGKRSPIFGMKSHGTNPRGWSQKITPGANAKIEVTFNPNAHGPNATGPVTRIVTIQTNDGGNKNSTQKFMFTANVTK